MTTSDDASDKLWHELSQHQEPPEGEEPVREFHEVPGRPWEPENTMGRSGPHEEMQPSRPAPQPRRNRNLYPNPGRWPYRDTRDHERVEDFQPDLSKVVLSQRVAIRLGYTKQPESLRVTSLARQISEDMPSIVKMAHDSGDAEVVFHCPFCGSGQVVARNDGTIECGFCQACFTVQVQPQYPAFPQTIDGTPVNVPGMGPQWPGQPADPTAGMPVPGPDDQDADGVPDDQEGPPEDGADDGGDDGGNPFAKKSFRTASGVELNQDQYLRHVALATTRNRDALIKTMRRENRGG